MIDYFTPSKVSGRIVKREVELPDPSEVLDAKVEQAKKHLDSLCTLPEIQAVIQGRDLRHAYLCRTHVFVHTPNGLLERKPVYQLGLISTKPDGRDDLVLMLLDSYDLGRKVLDYANDIFDTVET